jgi:DNA-binding MarR family transcriptional regulator
MADGQADETAMPLARLFAMATRYLIAELHGRLAERGWPGIRPSWGFALLAIRDGPMTSGGLAELLGVTKQAASKVVDAITAEGYVRREASSGDGRSKQLVLTPRGGHLLTTAEEVYTEIESEWSSYIGPEALEFLRSSLHRALLASYGDALPPIRPIW